jgi:hypothetical protein
MSVSISIPIAAKTAAVAQPAPAPAASSAAGTSTTTLTAAQLAKESVSQLQKQVNAGNKAAARELQRRQKLKQEQATASKGTSEAPDTQEAASEPGKGTQIDKTA